MNSRGHVHYDHVILLFVALTGLLFVVHGLAHRSLPLALLGGLGVSLAGFFLLALVLAALVERFAGADLPAGPFVLLGIVGTELGLAAAHFTRTPTPVLAGALVGGAAGLAGGAWLRRRKTTSEWLDDALGDGFLWLSLLYVVGPLAFFILKGIVTPFLESGFADGLKIFLVLAAMVGAAWAFLAALSRFGWLRKTLMFLLVFGLFFGAAAFFTGLFLADGWPLNRIYGALIVEGLVCAGLSAAVLRGSASDD